MFIEKIRQFR